MRLWWHKLLRIAAVFAAILLISALAVAVTVPEILDYLPAPFLALGGSSAPGLPMYSVTGTVTFGGEPVSEGEIRFVRLDNKYNPDVGKIRQGKFLARVKEGEHKVEIRAMKNQAEYIPARYNVNTELRFQAKERELNFELHPNSK
jgi:hypothetical protein